MKSMFVIIIWTSRDDIAIALSEDGKPMVFDTKDEALFYAQSELSYMWEVVEL